MKNRYCLNLTVAMIAGILSVSAVYAYVVNRNPIETFDFSCSDDLKDWSEKILNGKVSYWIDYEQADGYVHARSEKTCSAIYKTTKIDPSVTPMLSWHWSVAEFPSKDDPDIDDFPARLYVIFPSFCFSSTKFLEYVWDADYFEGTILNGPSENIKIIVAQSGPCPEGQWVSEQRNIYDDYTKVFGEAPSKKIRAVAIMSDSDSSKSSAEAMFDDIKIGYTTLPIEDSVGGRDNE